MNSYSDLSFETFNAKRLSPAEVADTFVTPEYFSKIASADHCYIIGPRGSGKTTLLRMLTGESLAAWRGKDTHLLRKRVVYSSIFLPTDDLWASQVSGQDGETAFSLQLLSSFIETVRYRTRVIDASGNPTHLPAIMVQSQEIEFVNACASAWGLSLRVPSLTTLQQGLDDYLLRLTLGEKAAPLSAGRTFELLTHAIRAFNRLVGQDRHRWALLLDEMELAPREIHREVNRHIRGGAQELILKLSMSPFDRYMHINDLEVKPAAGNDFQPFYLAGRALRESRSITEGLWRESLKAKNIDFVEMSKALGVSPVTTSNFDRRTSVSETQKVLTQARDTDLTFAGWLKRRNIDIRSLDTLSYNQRSATVRKVFPLLVFRNAFLHHDARRAKTRSRKKPTEVFSGAAAVTAMLEGNPRWIKSAFAQMLQSYDRETKSVPPGAQYDAVLALSNRFEALLKVLPVRDAEVDASYTVTEMVEALARHFHESNLSEFSPDPQNCFTIDKATESEAIGSIALGLYSGAFVHVRDRKSPAVLDKFEGQRFRLAYILAIRQGKEFPLRLGKDVKLSAVLGQPEKPSSPAVQLPDPVLFDWEES